MTIVAVRLAVMISSVVAGVSSSISVTSSSSGEDGSQNQPLGNSDSTKSHSNCNWTKENSLNCRLKDCQ